MPNDQALLLQYATSRDADAFKQLVRRYSTLVYSIACRVTGNRTTAEDVTQDCFFALARQAASIKGSLPAWLHRVALNLSLNVTRDEARRRRHETQASQLPEFEYEHVWSRIAPLVDMSLSQLPDDLREPLIRHFFLDQTQTQIAENLHVSNATVCRRIQEGIERLRAQLKQAGVTCGAAALSATLSRNASAAVPTRLASSLVKMALAGPTAVAATASTSAVLLANMKPIAAIVAVLAVGAVLTYQSLPSLHHEGSSTAAFTPRAYLSRLELKGDGYAQDSFSLAFQAAVKVLGRSADYDTIYALSTNAFCPAIEDAVQGGRSYWHIQTRLGDKAINTLCARYGLVAKKLDQSPSSGDEAAYRHDIIPIINQEMEAGNVVLVGGGWKECEPWEGIITDAQDNGAIFGAALNDRQDNPLKRPIGIWSLAPAAVTLTPHDSDIATIRWAVARIRGQSPFQAASKSVYGLKAMDAWIREMSETPNFCLGCAERVKNKQYWTCAYVNALTAAARYLRRIAPDFPPTVQSHLQSAAARYDRIVTLLAPAIADTGPGSYSNILGDLSKQKAHVANVLTPVKSEYFGIAQDLELAIANLKP